MHIFMGKSINITNIMYLLSQERIFLIVCNFGTFRSSQHRYRRLLDPDLKPCLLALLFLRRPY